MAIELVVVTPEGEALSETVQQVVLPGEAGEFGVLESHERFLTPLQLGPMEIIRDSGNEWAAITSGFAEVDGTRCVVLVDSCTLAGADGITEPVADCGASPRADGVSRRSHSRADDAGTLAGAHAGRRRRRR